MLLIEFTLSCFLFAAVTETHIFPAPRRFDRRGAVASEVDICSEIGINLLNLGGSAADAVGHPLKYSFAASGFLLYRRQLGRRFA